MVKGIDAVVDVIRRSDKKRYVKVSRFRGGVETFGTDDPEEARIMLMQGGFSIVGNDVWFVVEESLESMVEVGVDALFNGKEFLGVVFDTVEMKGAGNFTQVIDIEESIWSDVLRKFEPWLRRNGYHGFFCLEGFYDGSNIYVTDVTPRYPYICSHAYPRIIENYADVIVGVARGEDVEPKVNVEYSAQIGVYTDDPDRWRIIRYSGDDREWIAYRRVIKKGDYIWFVPGDYVVAVAISAGNNIDRVVEEAIERSEKVSSTSIYTQGREFKQYLHEVLERMSELGISW